MPINLQGSGSIYEGTTAPQLQGRDLGNTLAAILRDRLERQKLTGEGIAETIKNVRLDMQANKFIQSMKDAELIPVDYDAGGFGGAKLGEDLAGKIQAQRRLDLDASQQDYMKPYYGAQTNEAEARANALWTYGSTRQGGSGVPRIERPLPGGGTGQFTAKQAYDIDRELKANQAMKGMVDKEAAMEVEKARIEARRGGIDPNTYGPRSDGSPQSQTDLQRWEQLDDEIRKSKIIRDRYEKWYKVVSGVHGGEEPSTEADGGSGVDIPPAQPPPPTTAPPLPDATPRPTAQPSASPAATAQPTATPDTSAQQEPQASAAPTATPRPRSTPQRKMPPQKFSDVKDAIAAKYKVNDVILLLHPVTKTYEPYQLTEADFR